GVLDAEAIDSSLNRLALAAERVAGRVHPDHAQPEVRVALVPRLHIRRGAQRVDASEVPELDEDRVAAQLRLHPEERDVQPFEPAGKLGGGDFGVNWGPHTLAPYFAKSATCPALRVYSDRCLPGREADSHPRSQIRPQER